MARIISTTLGKTDVFDEVDEVPFGYSVWAIGRENFPFEKCVPLARSGRNIYEWQRNIDPNSLKYIEVETEELALELLEEAVSHGCDKERFYEIVRKGGV